jgi:hypothetical protein
MFLVLDAATSTVEWTYNVSGNGTEGASIGDVDNDGCMEIVVVPDWTSGGGLRVFDSATPVSDCNVIGYDDPTGSKENASLSPVYLRVYHTDQGITVETGRDATVSVYSTSGRLVERVSTSGGKTNISLPKGVYILKVEGTNLVRTVIM